MRVALVNTNRMQPPIAPIGLEYVAEAVAAAGHRVDVLDLCWAEDWRAEGERFLAGREFDLVGVTLRNTDDCAYTSRQSFLPEFADMVAAIRACTAAPVVLGGVGFSVMPDEVLSLCQADAGVWGGGEFALVEIANRLATGGAWRDVANVVWHGNGEWHRNPPSRAPLTGLPPMRRDRVDNRRYFREGGQVGIETKRGCAGSCIYCADPLAKGSRAQLRSPGAVADELERLLQQGIDHVHTCDSEFNLPEAHAAEVCREIIRRRLGDRLRWYAYCAPVPFTVELATCMRRAGCAGINFGVDNGDPGMLRRLRREFGPQEITEAAAACRAAGLPVMFDLLLGSPGESRESLLATVELMRRAAPDVVGVALGVRVYPGTELARLVLRGDSPHAGGPSPAEPLFFLEPAIAPFAAALLDEVIGDDPRFLFFDPSRPARNYNYNANRLLVEAVRAGCRGAYWDILRRYKPGASSAAP